MGKAIITENVGDGLYKARPLYDLTRLNNELDKLNKDQSEYSALLAKAVLSLSLFEDETEIARRAMNAVINQWQQDLLNTGSPPPIGRPLSPPPAGDNWFIHDLACAPEARGLRLAQGLVRCASGAALKLGLVRSDLIAVQGAWSFWEKLGYAPEETLSQALAAKVAGYGPDARYMTALISALKV